MLGFANAQFSGDEQEPLPVWWECSYIGGASVAGIAGVNTVSDQSIYMVLGPEDATATIRLDWFRLDEQNSSDSEAIKGYLYPNERNKLTITESQARSMANPYYEVRQSVDLSGGLTIFYVEISENSGQCYFGSASYSIHDACGWMSPGYASSPTN